MSNEIKKNGINFYSVSLKDFSTITKIRILSKENHVIRLDLENSFSDFDAKVLTKKIEKVLEKVNSVVISDYGKGTLSEVNKIVKLSKRRKIPVYVDPKGDNFEKYKYSNIITPNLHEFELVAGRCTNESMIEKKGMEIVRSFYLDGLIITMAEKGIIALSSKSDPIYLRAITKEAIDVTGAGDTFISVLSASLTSNIDFYNSCKLANIAAGIVVRKTGTYSVSFSEIQEAMLEYDNAN